MSTKIINRVDKNWAHFLNPIKVQMSIIKENIYQKVSADFQQRKFALKIKTLFSSSAITQMAID